MHTLYSILYKHIYTLRVHTLMRIFGVAEMCHVDICNRNPVYICEPYLFLSHSKTATCSRSIISLDVGFGFRVLT